MTFASPALLSEKLPANNRAITRPNLTAFAALVLFLSRHMGIALTVGLASALGIIPVLVVAALLVLVAEPRGSASCSEGNQLTVLFLSLTVLLSLIQFPYSDVTYFCYVATFAILLAASLISRFEHPPRMILIATVAFYVLYAAFVTNVHFMGDPYDSDYANTVITLPRAGGLGSQLHPTRRDGRALECASFEGRRGARCAIQLRLK